MYIHVCIYKVYIYIYICMYVCMHVCICLCICNFIILYKCNTIYNTSIW